jgi:hypothetical protein
MAKGRKPTYRMETSDDYDDVVFTEGKWRIIYGHDRSQLILQKGNRPDGSGAMRWNSLSFFRRQETARRLWREKVGTPEPEGLSLIPVQHKPPRTTSIELDPEDRVL